MSPCATCPVAEQCHYPDKPCECVDQGKFWTADQLRDYRRVYRVLPTPQEEAQMFLLSCEAWVRVFGGGR